MCNDTRVRISPDPLKIPWDPQKQIWIYKILFCIFAFSHLLEDADFRFGHLN